MTQSAHVFCVSNNDIILRRDLLLSPDLATGQVPVTVIRDASGAAAAYHNAVKSADADILIFAHQDIYFPEDWFARLLTKCEQLSAIDRSWAVAGVFGAESDGRLVGHLWDSALGTVCGGPFAAPREIVSLDEVVLILRRASGVSFDPALPSFHLYGTDIVLEARKAGAKSYVVDLPVIHNAKAVVRLDRHYRSAYKFMVRKWEALLPWPTVILPLTRNPMALWLRGLRLRYKALCRASTLHPALERPDAKARELGFSGATE